MTIFANVSKRRANSPVCKLSLPYHISSASLILSYILMHSPPASSLRPIVCLSFCLTVFHSLVFSLSIYPSISLLRSV